MSQFESYLTFFGFDASLISGFDWSWNGIGNHCETPTPPSPKTPKTKTPKTKTPKTKTPKTKTPKTKTPKSGKGKKSKTPKSAKGKKSPKGKTGRRRRELDSPAPRFARSATGSGKYAKSGKYGKSGKGKSGKGKSGKGKSPKSGYYNSPSPVCYPNYLENFCSYVINNYSGDHVDRLTALCYGPFFSTCLNNVLYVQQFTATFGQQYSDLFCPVFESGNFLFDLSSISFGDFNLDIDINIDYSIDFNVNLVTNINTYQHVMIEFIQSCGFTRVIDQILIQLTMEFNWDDFYGEFEVVFEYFEAAIATMLLDTTFVDTIVLIDAEFIASFQNVVQVFITQNIEIFFSTNIEFSIGGSFDWDCSNVCYQKMAEGSEAKNREVFRILIFDAKLRFTLLASLRSAILSEI